MRSFFECNPDEMRAWCATVSLPKYLADQIFDWVYKKGITDPEAMTNIGKQARRLVSDAFSFDDATIVSHQTASDGTKKLLLEWPATDRQRLEKSDSDRQTECVMIPTASRKTACISSQIGCPVGCRFCASGLGGLAGNLGTGQIVQQVHRLQRLPEVGRISHVVFMGMGEPLANYAAVTNAIRIINAPWGFGISARRITLSTVGLPAAIRRLVEFELPITLALSLHAPNDELRRSLIPWAEYAPIDDLLDACDAWFIKTGREITLEYLLLRNVNDRPEHARELAAVAQRIRANVNLIRYNEVRSLPFDRPTSSDVHSFQSILREKGVNVHIRASRGRDIAAACGQLRHERHDAHGSGLSQATIGSTD